MAKRDKYAIRISGLREGEHDFSFELDDAFFASFGHSDINSGSVRVQVRMEKNPGLITLFFSLDGEVEVLCDRCLDPLMAGIHSEETLFVRTGEERGELKEDVVVIGMDDHEIEVGQYMYEYVVLSLPVKRTHPKGLSGARGCNPEMLRRLEELRKKEGGREAGTDPRWDTLKGMIK